MRELENLIERLVILRGGNTIRPSDLPAKLTEGGPQSTQLQDRPLEQILKMGLPEDGIDLKKFLTEVEDGLIEQALQRSGHNKNQASRLLKMNRTTLIEKMKKKGMQVESSLT